MTAELWGPALDAEIAYRREQVERGVRAGRARAGRATGAQVTARGDAVAALRRPRRRWWLPGSGTWHVAR